MSAPTQHPVKTVGFIGGGNMASAMIGGMIKAGVVTASGVIVSDVNDACLEKLQSTFGVRTTKDSNEVAAFADVIFLAVKPHGVVPVLQSISSKLVASRHVIVSIAAGVMLRDIQDAVPKGVHTIRVMPNTPALVGAGCSAYALGEFATDADAEVVEKLLSSFGLAVRIQEKDIDAVLGVAASAPAYVFLFIEALADGGVRAGLPRATALQMATQTVLGSALMVKETGLHPGVLKDQVCSPGGTTIAAVHALEQGRLRGTVIDGVMAAVEKSRELGKPVAKL